MRSDERTTISKDYKKLKKVVLRTREHDSDLVDESEKKRPSIKLRIKLNNDKTTGTVTRVKNEDDRRIGRRLSVKEREQFFNLQKWKEKVQRERQALSRNARLIRRNLEKNSQSSKQTNTLPINPADISLFNKAATTSVASEHAKSKKRKGPSSPPPSPIDPASVSLGPVEDSNVITETYDEAEWPSLYEYLEVEDGVFTEIMDGLEINVEQLINVDEHTLLQYEGDAVEIEVDSTQFMKVLQGDDDEIVVLKVVPSTHKMSMNIEEKPMLKRVNVEEDSPVRIPKFVRPVIQPALPTKPPDVPSGKKCMRWNWENAIYEDVVVSRVPRVGWNVRKNSFWDWENEWANAKSVCRKCELKKDRREDEGASLIFRTPNPHAGCNNNLSDIPMSPSIRTENVSEILNNSSLLNDGDGVEINTETLYESMNFDSSGLVDLGYIEDL